MKQEFSKEFQTEMMLDNVNNDFRYRLARKSRQT